MDLLTEDLGHLSFRRESPVYPLPLRFPTLRLMLWTGAQGTQNSGSLPSRSLQKNRSPP